MPTTSKRTAAKKPSAAIASRAAAAAASPVKRERATKGANASAPVTIVSLAQKHDQDPKVVRAKARRKRDELATHLFPATADERWAFKAGSVKAVEAILFGKA